MCRTICVAVAVWIVSVLLAVPDLIFANVNTTHANTPFCDAYHYDGSEDWEKRKEWYARFRTMFRFVVLFAGPLVVIGALYSAIAFTLLRRSRETLDASLTVDAAARQLNSRRKVSFADSLVVQMEQYVVRCVCVCVCACERTITLN